MLYLKTLNKIFPNKGLQKINHRLRLRIVNENRTKYKA